jgi:hypothetical protein
MNTGASRAMRQMRSEDGRGEVDNSRRGEEGADGQRRAYSSLREGRHRARISLRIESEEFELRSPSFERLLPRLQYEFQRRLFGQSEIQRVDETATQSAGPPVAGEVRRLVHWMLRALKEERVGTASRSACHTHRDAEEHVSLVCTAKRERERSSGMSTPVLKAKQTCCAVCRLTRDVSSECDLPSASLESLAEQHSPILHSIDPVGSERYNLRDG